MRSYIVITLSVACLSLLACEQEQGMSGKSPENFEEVDSIKRLDPNAKYAEVTFNEEEHDFGQLAFGSDASFDFEFTNTGEDALIITDVKPSCGCTENGEWTKGAIAVGKSGIIPIKYDSKRVGKFKKKITVKTNCYEKDKAIYITGEILPDPNAEKK